MSKPEDKTSLIAAGKPPTYDTTVNVTLNSLPSDYGTAAKSQANDVTRKDPVGLNGTDIYLPPYPSKDSPISKNAEDEEVKKETGDKEEEEGSLFKDFSKLKAFTLIVMSVVNLICSIFFSMIAPFYPIEVG